MTDKEKFNKICSVLDLGDDTIRDVSRAVCCADMLYGESHRPLDYDAFLNEELPKVQMLRVYIDTILICTDDNSYLLTCPSSAQVAKLAGCRLRSEGYSEEAECLRILNELLEQSVGGAGGKLRYLQDLYETAVDLLSSRKRTNYTTQEDLLPVLDNLIAAVRPKVSEKRLRGTSEAFVRKFIEVSDQEEGLDEFISHFYQSLIRFAFVCADDSFRISPVISVSRARELSGRLSIPVHGISCMTGSTPASEILYGVFKTGSNYPLIEKEMYKVLLIISRFVNEHPLSDEHVKNRMER